MPRKKPFCFLRRGIAAKQAKILEKQLAALKLELSQAEAKRDALLRRQNKANNGSQLATGAVKNPFERMEEKVREVEKAWVWSAGILAGMLAINSMLVLWTQRIVREIALLMVYGFLMWFLLFFVYFWYLLFQWLID